MCYKGCIHPFQGANHFLGKLIHKFSHLHNNEFLYLKRMCQYAAVCDSLE